MITSTDPIADFLTRIRNAIHARHRSVEVPSSRMKREIARILKEQRYISNYTEIKDNKQGVLKVALRYNSNGDNAIKGLKRISKPGRRIYVGANEIPRVLNGLGCAIISTSKGVLTDLQAREMKIGGEVICYIW